MWNLCQHFSPAPHQAIINRENRESKVKQSETIFVESQTISEIILVSQQMFILYLPFHKSPPPTTAKKGGGMRGEIDKIEIVKPLSAKHSTLVFD